ncbi:Protease Do-like 7 [Ancistrocladus abbreviatus]
MAAKINHVDEAELSRMEEGGGGSALHDPSAAGSCRSSIAVNVVQTLQKLLAEAIGTYFIVFTGCAAIVVDKTYGSVTYPGISVTWGLIIMIVIYSLGHISGAHFNPAVTITFAILRRFPLKQVPLYITAQLTGSILASGTLSLLLDVPPEAYFGTEPSGSNAQSLVMEIIISFLLMFVIFGNAVDERAVQDLHSITPDNFLEVSGAVIHPLSYQQARNFHFNCGLVYVAEPGYMLFRAGVPHHAIIKKFAGEEISRLADLISVLSKLSMGVRVPLEYITYMDRHRRKSVLVTVDRHEWYAPPRVYARDDSTGLWIARLALPSNSPLLSSVINYAGGTDPETMLPGNDEVSLVEYADQQNSHKLVDGAASMEAHYNHVFEEAHSRDGSLHEPREENLDHSTISETAVVREYQAAITPGANTSVAESVIEPTLVLVEVHVPPSCMLDGVHSQHFLGTGVIIHHSQNMGLVAVDKNTVAISACDVMLSFAAFPIEIPGEVVFLHPVHNYAVVAYDPSALGSGASVVRAAELLPEPTLHRGDTVYLVGLSRSLRATSRKSIVTNPCDALDIVSADCPRYRAINMEVIELDTDFGSTFSGVLTDDQGRVQAVWGSFSGQLKHSNHSSDHRFVRGIPIYTISQVLDKILSGAKGPALLINGVKRPMPLVRILEVELYATPLSKAQSFGLTDDWVQALVKKDPLRRQVLHVKGCFAGSKAEHVLEHGDMILAINKEPVTCFSDVENACQELDKNGESDGRLHMTILRQGHEIEVFVGTDVRDGNGTVRVINWCGCIVQDPHPAVRALGFLPEEGHCVYVASIYLGSPVHRGGLYAFQWIVEVNGKSTHDLDAFVKVTKKLQDGEVACVRTINLKGKPRMLNVKQDLHYWPTWELRFDPDTAKWRRTIIKALHPDVS